MGKRRTGMDIPATLTHPFQAYCPPPMQPGRHPLFRGSEKKSTAVSLVKVKQNGRITEDHDSDQEDHTRRTTWLEDPGDCPEYRDVEEYSEALST